MPRPKARQQHGRPTGIRKQQQHHTARGGKAASKHRPGSQASHQLKSDKSSSNSTGSSTRPAIADPYDQRATIPFDFTSDTILLIGDGDLSFARSLVTTHIACALTATTYDSLAELTDKYPQASDNIAAIHAEDDTVQFHHSVDARAVHTAKSLRDGRWNRIVFNFPHVGGVSTDVNRQVRANQELLVGFFGSALKVLAERGTVIVTLFEGEPYTLWNIRDLARHSGLEVQRSFRFDAAVYPGYEHRRTLGNVSGGGGWKGEDRAARTFVFMRRGEGAKRSRREGSSDED